MPVASLHLGYLKRFVVVPPYFRNSDITLRTTFNRKENGWKFKYYVLYQYNVSVELVKTTTCTVASIG